MQIQVGDDQYITARGTELDRHQDIIKKAYESAHNKFKFKKDEPATVNLVDDDDGIHVTVSVAGEDYLAERKGDKWYWVNDVEEAKPQ